MPNDGVCIRKEEIRRKKISLATTGERNPNFGKNSTFSVDHRMKISLSNTGKTRSEETRKKMSFAHTGDKNSMFGKIFSEDHRMKISLSHYDIWYGSVKYSDDRKYCELWTSDLLTRIRSFFGNISVLSGKTKSDNKNRNMSCHHVYYQKKACCEWDEDTQGYYAMIDNQKYYIKGDPNKFVTLTAGENTIVEKDKLKWVKIFEDIIENKYSGKCYYTKEEYEILQGD